MRKLKEECECCRENKISSSINWLFNWLYVIVAFGGFYAIFTDTPALIFIMKVALLIAILHVLINIKLNMSHNGRTKTKCVTDETRD